MIQESLIEFTINELKLQRLLHDKSAKTLQNLEARTPNFYMQPKIKKRKSRQASHYFSKLSHKQNFTIH